MTPRRACAGTMSEGARHCYFKGVVEHRSRWWCKKCYRLLLKSHTPPVPLMRPEAQKPEPIKTKAVSSSSAEVISKQEILSLYRSVRRHEQYGDHMAVPVAVLQRQLPRLLKEVMRLRGIPLDDIDVADK